MAVAEHPVDHAAIARIEDCRSQLSTALFQIEAAIPKAPEIEQHSLRAAANICRAVLGRLTTAA